MSGSSPKSAVTLQRLRRYESRNVTFQEADGSWPIVWTQARGTTVIDADGRRYLDLTAAFGVAAAGHANPRVVRAGARQMGTLLHAMGDVHPHPLKADLAQALSRLTFERWTRRTGSSIEGKSVFGTSGSEAVEMALKTARLATGKPGIIAFSGGYHGLGYGALNATHRDLFRGPFLNQLREFGHFVAFPETGTPEALEAMEAAIRRLARTQSVGAILAEPIQARGGIRIPPPGFLRRLRSLADDLGAVLILDEIYTGFGRTGRWFACEHESVVPDLICLGKALTGGFPLSACVGRAGLMDRAWPPSAGEAIHTSTYLGHPVGCAMALAQIAEIESRQLVRASATRGRELLKGLTTLARRAGRIQRTVRGIGLMTGIEFRHADGSPATAESIAVMKALLRRGVIVLPEGADSEVISFTPPLTLSSRELKRTLRILGEVLETCVP
jgi:4-aminobutyrate aminotransferase-like enzyme